MSDIRIEVFSGSYSNDDAYNRVLGYIGQKTYLGGYGFSCNSHSTIIKQFQLSEQYSHYKNPQKIWHFIITFSEPWKHYDLLCMGVHVSAVFKDHYQILFGLDTIGQNPHLHFGVNAFSYRPDDPILNHSRMSQYMLGIQEYLKRNYPYHTVTLQFQRKGG